MKKISIGLIIPSQIGYSETFFVSKIQALRENGFNVFVFCRDINETTMKFNYIPIIKIFITLGLLIFIWNKIRLI